MGEDVELVERGFRGDKVAKAKFRELLRTGQATEAQMKRMDELMLERMSTEAICLTRLDAAPDLCALERAIVRLVQAGFAGYHVIEVTWPPDGDSLGGWADPGTAFLIVAGWACPLASDEDASRWRREFGALAVFLLMIHRDQDRDAREHWEGLRDTYTRPKLALGPDGQPVRGEDGDLVFVEHPPGFVNPIPDLRATLALASEAGVLAGERETLVRDYLRTGVPPVAIAECVRRCLAALDDVPRPKSTTTKTLFDLTDDGKAWALAGEPLKFPKTERAGSRAFRRVPRRSAAGKYLESLLRPGAVPWDGAYASEGRSLLSAALVGAGGNLRIEGTGSAARFEPRPSLTQRAKDCLRKPAPS